MIDKECADGTVCWWVEVYAYDDCPGGGDIDASFYSPEHEAPLEQTDRYFSALAAGELDEIEFWTVELDVRDIELTFRGCRDDYVPVFDNSP